MDTAPCGTCGRADASALEHTVRTVELAHQIGANEKTKGYVSPPVYPMRLEEEMGNRYVGFIDRARPYYASLAAAMTKTLEQLAVRGDGGVELAEDAGEVEQVRNMLAAAQARWGQWVGEKEMETLAAYYGQRISAAQRVDLGRIIRQSLGVDVPLSDVVGRDLIAEMAQATAGLVSTIPGRLHGDIAALAIRAITKRMRADTFGDLLEKRFGVGENHARYIARNQLGHLNASINEERQTSLGITHYFWMTMEDEAVRPVHRGRWHKRFAWADPPHAEPYDGHPGHPPNCRCGAHPDLSPIIAMIKQRRILPQRKRIARPLQAE